MIVFFGAIPLGTSHLTGPTGDDAGYQNTDAEHPTARGKPQIQEIGAERDEKTLSFFFDEGFCNVEVEHARLVAALKSRSPAPLTVPGRAYNGTLWRVDSLKVTARATNRAGVLKRIEATITLKEVPRGAGGAFGLIGLAFGAAATSLAARIR